MLWLIVLLAMIANAGAVVLLFLDVKDHKDLYPLWKENKIPRSVLIYIIIMVIVSMALTIFITLFYKDNHWIFTLKRVILLILLWPIAYTDFTNYRIPNRIIVTGIVARVFVLLLELGYSVPNVWQYLLTEVIASVVLLVISFICTIFVKNGIGYGDMKLFVVMGLFLGLQGTWGAVFVSLIVSFIASIFLLIGKKKGRKDAIPFGPSIMIGTYISVFLTGM